MNLVAETIFGGGVARIGMIVREDNHLVQRLIGELGGQKEALWYRQVNGAVFTQNGVPVNMIQYGLYSEVWYEKQTESRVVGVAVGGDDSGMA